VHRHHLVRKTLEALGFRLNQWTGTCTTRNGGSCSSSGISLVSHSATVTAQYTWRTMRHLSITGTALYWSCSTSHTSSFTGSGIPPIARRTALDRRSAAHLWRGKHFLNYRGKELRTQKSSGPTPEILC